MFVTYVVITDNSLYLNSLHHSVKMIICDAVSIVKLLVTYFVINIDLLYLNLLYEILKKIICDTGVYGKAISH